MLGAIFKVCLRTRFLIILISLSGLMGCAGHNTASRLDSLEERATDQDLIKLRMDTAEARLLVLEEDLAIVKEYTIPAGARWIESKAQKAARTKPAPLSQPRVAQQSSVQGDPNTQTSTSYSKPSANSTNFEPARSESIRLEPLRSEPVSFESGTADLKALQPVHGYDDMVSLEKPVQGQVSAGLTASIDLTDLSAIVHVSPAPFELSSSSPKVQPVDSALLGLPLEFITGTRSYDLALAKYYQGKYKEAQTALANFSKDNPKNRLRPNAIYWEGEAHYALKDYLAAILGFKKVVEQFPKHAKSADALLKIGMSYAKLNDQDNARFYWGILLDDFPRSTSAAKAKRMINAFQHS